MERVLQRRIASHLTRTRNIQRLYIVHEIPEIQVIKNELKELIDELVESKEITEQVIHGPEIAEQMNHDRERQLEEEKSVLEENADDDIKRVARLEREIFEQGDVIKKLQSQQAATQNELVETRNNLTTQLEQMQNELVETRNNLTTQLEQTQNELAATRNELAELRRIVEQLTRDN
jgi:predicted RNase H-like nuclease (RuvC/YqgF family)